MSVPTLPAEDQLELGTLIARLCHALDFSRPADFVGAFTADGVYQAVSSEATGRRPRFRHCGPQELLAFATAAVEKRQGLGRHWTGNLVLDAEGADHARGVSYVLFVEIDADTKDRRVLISGVHEDHFVRTEDGWRVESRTVVADI